jgi:hypothetical protein
MMGVTFCMLIYSAIVAPLQVLLLTSSGPWNLESIVLSSDVKKLERVDLF